VKPLKNKKLKITPVTPSVGKKFQVKKILHGSASLGVLERSIAGGVSRSEGRTVENT